MKSVIFLDLDETLVRQERAFHLAYSDTARFLLAELGEESKRADALAEQIPLAAQQVLDLSPMSDAIRRCRFGGRDLLWGTPGQNAESVIGDSLPGFRTESWKLILIKAGATGRGADHLVETMHSRFRSSMNNHLSLFPEVRAALGEMAVEFRLAIITNGLEQAQKEKLVVLGLESFFEQVVASASVGMGKPDSNIFSCALEKMGCRASDAVMIGDALDADVQGALRCGFGACWLNRATLRGSDFQPQISDLSQWREALVQAS